MNYNKQPCVWWELNPGPLQEQQVLLTIEPPLQYQNPAVLKENPTCLVLFPADFDHY